MNIYHLIVICVAGVIIADLVSHPAGSDAVFGGIQQLWQIATDPLNTNNLGTQGKKGSPSNGR